MFIAAMLGLHLERVAIQIADKDHYLVAFGRADRLPADLPAGGQECVEVRHFQADMIHLRGLGGNAPTNTSNCMSSEV